MADFKNFTNNQNNPIKANGFAQENIKSITFSSALYTPSGGNLDINRQVFETPVKNILFINKLWDYQGEYDIILNEVPEDLEEIVQDISHYPHTFTMNSLSTHIVNNKGFSVLIKRKKGVEVLNPNGYPGGMVIHSDTLFNPKLSGDLIIDASSNNLPTELKRLFIEGKLQITDSYGGLIENLHVADSNGNGIKLIGCKNIIIRRVEVISPNTAIILQDCENIIIEGLYHSDNLLTNPSISMSNCTNCTVRDSVLSNVGIGIIIADCTNCSFENISLKDARVSIADSTGTNSGNKGINIKIQRGMYSQNSDIALTKSLNGYTDKGIIITHIKNGLEVFAERADSIHFNSPSENIFPSDLSNVSFRRDDKSFTLPNDIPFEIYLPFLEGYGLETFSLFNDHIASNFSIDSGEGFEWKNGPIKNYSIKVKDNDSSLKINHDSELNFVNGFTMFFVIKPLVFNAEQVLLSKMDLDPTTDASIPTSSSYLIMQKNQFLDVSLFSGVTQILGINKELLRIQTDNIFSDGDDFIGIGIVLSIKNRTLSVIRNQAHISYSVLTTQGRNYANVSDFPGIKNVNCDVHIGNQLLDSNTESGNKFFQGEFSLLAITPSEIHPEEVREIFYDMGLRDSNTEKKIFSLAGHTNVEIRPGLCSDVRIVPEDSSLGILLEGFKTPYFGALIVQQNNDLLKKNEFTWSHDTLRLSILREVFKGDKIRVTGGIKERSIIELPTHLIYSERVGGFDIPKKVNLNTLVSTPLFTPAENTNYRWISYNAARNRLVYRKNNSVYTANVDGTGEALITASGDCPIWSFDGRYIFYSGNSDQRVRRYEIDTTLDISIFTSPVGVGVYYFHTPANTTTNKISFNDYYPSIYDIYTCNFDGSDLTNILDNSGYYEASWNPNGTQLTLSTEYPSRGLTRSNINGSSPSQYVSAKDYRRITYLDDQYVIATRLTVPTNITTAIINKVKVSNGAEETIVPNTGNYMEVADYPFIYI